MQASPGIQLACDPQLDGEGMPESYNLYLYNGTIHRVLFEIKILTGGRQRLAKFGPLEPYGKQQIGSFDYDWLNEKLSLSVDIRTKEPGGTGPKNLKEVNIKAKTFFARLVDVPWLYRDAHLYDVFPRLEAGSVTTAPATAPNLKEITREAKKQSDKRAADKSGRRLVQTDLEARSEFNEVLDLHLGALVSNPSAVPKHQVLSTQLAFFERYLDEAVRLGVDSVFIIHGVGTGILKREIHIRLQRQPFVRKYKNEYHHKYGYGATEVIFD